MEMNRVRISFDRKTGQAISKTNLGTKKVDNQAVAEASIALLTGKTINECLDEIKSRKEQN